MTNEEESNLTIPAFLQRKKETMDTPPVDNEHVAEGCEQFATPTIDDALNALKQIDAEILANEKEEAEAITKYAEASKSLASRRVAAKKLLRTLARKV